MAAAYVVYPSHTRRQTKPVFDAYGNGSYLVEARPNSFETKRVFKDVSAKPRIVAPVSKPPMPAAPPKFERLKFINYVEAANIPQLSRQIAFSNARAAMKDLGIGGLQVSFFRLATAAEAAAIEARSFTDWTHPSLTAVSGFTYDGSDEIWLKADLTPMDMAAVAAHEVAHRSRFVAGMSKEDDEAWAQEYAAAFMWRHHRISI